MSSLIEQHESGVRSYCRKFTATFERAKGSYVYDADGRKYLDFFCGAGALNYGHNNDFIKKAVIEYIANDGIMHALDMTTAAKEAFIESMICNVLEPRNLDYRFLFPGPTGTNAIEAALKTARKFTGRTDVWAFMGAFHGMTLGALSLTSDAYSRNGAGAPLLNVVHIPSPYMFPEMDVIGYMQALIDDDHSGVSKPAAIVIETLQAEGGIYAFDNVFLQRLRHFCTEQEIILIIDDIQIGCWRTGSFFSFERAGIAPDVIVLSKSIGGYGTPFSLVLLKDRLDCLSPGEHNGTFRGNQLAMVAARAAIEYSQETPLSEKVNNDSDFLKSGLDAIAKKHNGIEARGLGFIWGLDLGSGVLALDAVKRCFGNGLILETCGRNDRVLKVMPPLTASREELSAGLEIIEKSLEAVFQ